MYWVVAHRYEDAWDCMCISAFWTFATTMRQMLFSWKISGSVNFGWDANFLMRLKALDRKLWKRYIYRKIENNNSHGDTVRHLIIVSYMATLSLDFRKFAFSQRGREGELEHGIARSWQLTRKYLRLSYFEHCRTESKSAVELYLNTWTKCRYSYPLCSLYEPVRL